MIFELRANGQYLRAYHESCLICLTETWLTANDPDSSIDLEDYQLLRMDRNQTSGKMKGGGVGAGGHITRQERFLKSSCLLCAYHLQQTLISLRTPFIILYR